MSVAGVPKPGRRAALRALAMAAVLTLPFQARAGVGIPAEVAAELPNAKLIGSGRLSFMLMHVYDARLWGRDSFNAADHAKTPLALELEYARPLDGAMIAERSLVEMKRIGDISDETAQRWLAALKQIFIDVNKGDRITAVQVPGIAARLFLNGKFSGEVRDAEFTRLFFGIWLSPRTSQPKLREALLGPARAAS